MNVWDWVHDLEADLLAKGNHRLAELVDSISTAVVNDDHDKVDAVIPEALALARQEGNPWIEIYFRHWQMQSQVLVRNLIKTSLADTLDLLEKANREETKGCPQSVCVTQDVCIAYSLWDGPGFSKERIDVCEETLERINVNWDCFSCISKEYGSALVDAGRPEAALAFLEGQIRAERQNGNKLEKNPYRSVMVSTLEALGRDQEALEYNDAAINSYAGTSFAKRKQLTSARLRAKLGMYESAVEKLIDYQSIRGNCLLTYIWQRAVYYLIKGGALEDVPKYSMNLADAYTTMLERGVYRRGIEAAFRFAELALDRGRPAIAALAADDIAANLEHLQADHGVAQQLAKLRQDIATAEVAPLIEEDGSEGLAFNESEYQRCSSLGDDGEETLCELGVNLYLLGYDAKAIETLARCHQKYPESEPAFRRLCNVLRETLNVDRLNAVADQLARDEKSVHYLTANWMLGRQAVDRQDYETGAAYLKVLMEGENIISDRAFSYTGLALRRNGELEAALEVLKRAIEEAEEKSSFHWEFMLVATLLGRWDLVRQSAAALDLNVTDGEGPIEDNYGYCLIRFDEQRRRRDLMARRTGPTTARIVELASAEDPPHYDDLVAFDCHNLGEDDPDNYPIYPVEAVMEPGNYRIFEIDGIHPPKAWLDGLRATLRERNIPLEIRSTDEYLIYNPEEEEDNLKGLFGYFGLPAGTDRAEIHALLLERVSELAYPLVWLSLVKDLGLKAEYDRQLKLAEPYDFL